MICKLYVGANEVIYANGEEELFVDLSELEFEFEVSALFSTAGSKRKRGSCGGTFANLSLICPVCLLPKVPQQDADSAISGKWKRTDEELKQIRKVCSRECCNNFLPKV